MTPRQFPLRPCFGIASIKAQGQTLKKVGIFLNRPFFSHGQKYVAQSREKDALMVLTYDNGKTDNFSKVSKVKVKLKRGVRKRV